MNPTTSVIISAYNRPYHLERCLWSLTHQSDQDFDIVIADDGSKEETRNLIQNLRQKLPFTIKHVWQEDKGFRKSAILNKAVHHTQAELLIFLDQDVVVSKDLIKNHKSVYAPNTFSPGGYLFLNENLSKKIDLSLILKNSYENVILSQNQSWLYTIRFYRFIQKIQNRIPVLLGLNFSVSRSLLEKINGFDLMYEKWGYEDKDFAFRMEKSGALKNTHIWTETIAYHIWHIFDSSKAKYSYLNPNKPRMKQLKRGLLPWRCERGFLEAIQEPYQVDGTWVNHKF